MKAIITGATGMIGKGVLLECLDHKEVNEVLVITRKNTGVQHPKLKELIHQDFASFDSVKDQLTGYDACYHCMGVSAATMSEEDYTTLTYNASMALANTLHSLNPNMTFIYVSGVGTDSTEKGRQMWARVKGKTENDLLKIGFKQAFMFRPGIIFPLRGIRSSTKLYQFMYDYFMWLLRIVKAIDPSSVTDTTKIGLAMINAHQKGFSETILHPPEINEAATL